MDLVFEVTKLNIYKKSQHFQHGHQMLVCNSPNFDKLLYVK